MVEDIYGGRVSDEMLENEEYRQLNPGEWWIPSGIVEYSENPDDNFYMPTSYKDPFGNETKVTYYKDYYLMIEETEDALKNKVTILSFDLRFLAPREIKDPNENITEVCFDVLGFVVGSAIKGKDEADDLDTFDIDLSDTEIIDFFNDPLLHGRDLLQHATARFVYDFDRYKISYDAKQINPDQRLEPVAVGSIVRETHFRQEKEETLTKLQYSFEYSDGLGRVAMKKFRQNPVWQNR